MKKILKIKNKCGYDLSKSEDLFHSLCNFAQKRMGFKKPPVLNLVSDTKNANKPLGKTAYYDPETLCVTIYTDNRHVKDILRSFSHELVHHTQNENGMLNDSGYHGIGYAQKNKNLRQSEKEAYLKGNMCFRDWEDGLKQEKPTIYNEWRTKTMSTKKWKNNELMENLTEKFGFKMDLTQLNESSCGGERKKEENLKEEEEKDSDKDEKSEEKSMKGSDPKNYPPGADSKPKDGEISDYEATIAKKIQQSKDKKKNMKESRMMKIIRNEIRKQLKERK
jgi:hypothetical protein|tara:strand:- start:323 stop:1156 length:834 start_codon:yes stop_codon:yes gene_type:complete